MTHPDYLIEIASGHYDGDIPPGGLYVETKHSGVRASWVEGALLASKDTGNPIGGGDHIAQACRHMESLAGCELFLDAEFMVEGDYLKTLSHMGKGENAPQAGQIFIFDMVPLVHWKSDSWNYPLWERKKLLRELLQGYHSECTSEAYLLEPPVSFVEHTWCANHDEVCAVYTRVVESGGEGVMVKNPDTLYRRRRSRDWQKWMAPGWAQREMAMTTIYTPQKIINTTGQTLAFTGRLIGRHSTERPTSTAWQQTELWETSGGAWIVVSYRVSTREGKGDVVMSTVIPPLLNGTPTSPNEHQLLARQIAVMDALKWTECARMMAKEMGWQLEVKVA